MFRVIIDYKNGRLLEWETLTSGSVGPKLQFEFSPEWDGLIKTVCFDNGEDELPSVTLRGDSIEIPHEAMERAGVYLKAGVYGETADGQLVIPTVYISLGAVRKGAGKAVRPSLPKTPDWTAGIEEEVNRAVNAAESVLWRADHGLFDGKAPYIAANGNWFVGGKDSGVRAEGKTGPAGKDGAPGPAGPSGGNNAPEYAVAEAEAVASRVQSVRGCKTLVVSALADWHLDSVSEAGALTRKSAELAAQGLEEIRKIIPIDADLKLGDYTWGSDDYTARQCTADIMYVKKLQPANDHQIWLRGNHDLCYGKNRDRMLTENELYSYIEAGNFGTVSPYGTASGYGYRDFEKQKIRLIYLNTCDVYSERIQPESGTGAVSEWIGTAQDKWIAETALDFSAKPEPEAWGVVFASHHPLNYPYQCFTQFLKMLEDYRNKKAGKISYYIDGTLRSYEYDFTNTSPAELICAINGHSHNFRTDYISSDSAIPGWLPRITVPNILAGRENEAATYKNDSFAQLFGEFDGEGQPVYYRKSPETAKATSFYIISVDREKRTVYAHCFGAGHDTELSFDNRPSYKNLIPSSLAQDLSSVYDGDGIKPNTYLSSSSGKDGSKTGYYAVGYFPIPGEGSAAWPHGEGHAVVRLSNISFPAADGSCRFGFYSRDLSKYMIASAPKVNISGSIPANAVLFGKVDDSGNIFELDISNYISYISRDLNWEPVWMRICAKGADETSVITVNELI